jgi:hypothetical protein
MFFDCFGGIMNKYRLKAKEFKKFSYVLILLTCIFVFSGFITVKTDSGMIALNMNGKQRIDLHVGEQYTDQGVVVIENGIDVSDKVQIVNDVDTSTAGEYLVSYNFKNITAHRKVTVLQPKSYIKLNGQKNLKLSLGEQYIEEGYVAFNEQLEDITDQVTVEGQVDAYTIGQYTVKYHFETSYGFKIMDERIVEVFASPLDMSLKEFSLDGFFSSAIVKQHILDKENLDTYLDETLFIGDSRNCSLTWYGFLPKSNVWGIDSLTPLNVSYKKIKRFDKGETGTVINMLEKYQPKRVVFTFGIDSVGANEPEMLSELYGQFIVKVKEKAPNTIIVISNALPVDAYLDLEDKRGWAPTNDKINKYNYHLAKMCEQLGVFYLDSSSTLKDERGLGKPEYFNKDYIHLSKAGQQLIYDYITTHPALLN